MTRFLLIRHGETDMVGQRLAGRLAGVHLNETGRMQANHLPERLRQTEIHRIYASPLERARETAQPLGEAKGLTVRISEAIAELDYGEWTGRSFHELDGEPEWRRFNEHRSAVRVPGGESMLEVQVRAMSELERLRRLHGDATVAVVSHAEWIRSALMHALAIPLDLFFRLEISPASVSTLRLGNGAPIVEGINSV